MLHHIYFRDVDGRKKKPTVDFFNVFTYVLYLNIYNIILNIHVYRIYRLLCYRMCFFNLQHTFFCCIKVECFFFLTHFFKGYSFFMYNQDIVLSAFFFQSILMLEGHHTKIHNLSLAKDITKN